MWVIRTLLGIVLIAVLLYFAFLNAGAQVTVRLTPGSTDEYIYVGPLIIVCFWAFLLGMVLSFIFFVTVYFKQVSEIRRYKRTADSLSGEIAALRNRPIEESTDSFLSPGKDNDK